MKETDFITLGFKKQQETIESSGCDTDWHYYVLKIGDITLISNDNEEAEKTEWYVYIFDLLEFCFTNFEDVYNLIQILKKGLTNGTVTKR